MTGDNIDELIGRLRKMAAYWNDNRLILEAADALEQQASEIGRLSRDLAAAFNACRALERRPSNSEEQP